jgi:hypothetical protein
MQANPDNGWFQIQSIRLVGFEFEARRATIGGIQISEGRRLVGFKIPLFLHGHLYCLLTVSRIPQSFSRGISTQRVEIPVSSIGGQFKPHLWGSSDVTGSGITESREPKPEMKGR